MTATRRHLLSAVARQRPDPGARGTAVIRWRPEHDGGRFCAVSRLVDHDDEVVVAETPVLESPPRNRDAVLVMAQAVEDLELTLVAAGWNPDGVGNRWYERRFKWMP